MCSILYFQELVASYHTLDTLPPALQLLTSFHLGCGYMFGKNKNEIKQKKERRKEITPQDAS